jgi:hypothetical protein
VKNAVLVALFIAEHFLQATCLRSVRYTACSFRSNGIQCENTFDCSKRRQTILEFKDVTRTCAASADARRARHGVCAPAVPRFPVQMATRQRACQVSSGCQDNTPHLCTFFPYWMWLASTDRATVHAWVFLVHLAQTEHFCIFLENARTFNTLHPDASLRLLWYDGAGRMRGPSVYESLQHVSVLLLCATWHLVASRSLQRAAVARAGASDTCTVE